MDSLSSTPSQSPLHLLIIGAGICGLATAISSAQAGIRVTVFEAASPLHEVGAGMQITPNGTRILRSLGVFANLQPLAAIPDALTIHRYNGERLVYKEGYKKEIEERFGAPIWCLHRVDLHQTLAKRAKEVGVDVRLGVRIGKVDFEGPSLCLGDGVVVRGDVVLAADGLWSSTRNLLLGESTPPKPTGDLAYRILLDVKDIEDLELRDWITKPALHIWLGPNSHVVGYSIRGGQMYNLVLLCPDDLPAGVAKAQGDLDEMRRLFAGWDPMYGTLSPAVKHDYSFI
ncbi:MAG: hypothetical protein M1812_007352 [Candelaria pacifica]|nr:MAG: hypothetical protein M1812_007352 [Candelaria pacifica]